MENITQSQGQELSIALLPPWKLISKVTQISIIKPWDEKIYISLLQFIDIL